MNTNRSEGITPSERYLNKLCRGSFLSLWSYANLHTDEGRKNCNGVGHELCDLLVVFGNNVIIFSIKHIEFNRSVDTQTAWKRWFKKAVLKSAKQLYGAESWLLRYPDRIYIDPHCQKKIPVPLPDKNSIKVYRVVVSLGIYEACRKYFGGKSLGSLIIESDLTGEAHFELPFHIGHVNREKGFVHVFEDFTLDAVLQELDTISDFIAYLSKKEQLLSKESPTIIATGEEQLLSIYLTRLNSAGEHDFVLPIENCDFLSLDEGFWEKMIYNPQYLAKKEADRISYIWDRLIEHFIKYGCGYDLSGENEVSINEREKALRLMASEPRMGRRELAYALFNLIKTSEGRGATRLVISNNFPDVAYLFLIFPNSAGQVYDEYRKRRRTLLLAYCKVAKLLARDASYIVGIATEPMGDNGSSEDLLALKVSEWTEEMQREAESLQQEFSLLLENNVKKTEFSTKEYPDLLTTNEKKLNNRPLNRKQRRALESKRRSSKKIICNGSIYQK